MKIDEKIIKKEIRILGIDDSPFDKSKKSKVLVIGTIFRGGTLLDGVISTKITVDGADSTSKLIKMINNSRHRSQLQIIMIDGIAFGGFNIVDIKKLSKKTKLPVITVMRNLPNMEKIEKALSNVPNHEKKLETIKKAGTIYSGKTNRGNIHFQCANISPEKVKEILTLSCTSSNIPEPIRVSHLIASGIALGESRGRA